jgi:hypothetical protein
MEMSFEQRVADAVAKAGLRAKPDPKKKQNIKGTIGRGKANHSEWTSGGLSVENPSMAGPGNDPVQVYRTGRANRWEFLRLWTGFELPSSCADLP